MSFEKKTINSGMLSNKQNSASNIHASQSLSELAHKFE
jgi:hypothetical protein